MWPASEAWRAPVGDFPPPWASAWGDDQFGLWADLTVNGATQRMRWIEPSGPEGFWMGAPQEERDRLTDMAYRKVLMQREGKHARRVVVHAGFWLADTPCTQSFWTAVMGDNPSHFQDQPDAASRPVEQVSWDDVETFVIRFAATPEWACEGRLCLPTECQWEYAARAGSSTAYWWGDEPNSDMANWNQEQGGATPVKRYPANPWGLFDVHGNVWEWCVDLWRHRLVAAEAQSDSLARVVRGGSWAASPVLARSAYRYGERRAGRDFSQGFRFALMSCSRQGAEHPQGMGPEGPAW